MCTSVYDCMCESECMLKCAYVCFVMSECDVPVCVVHARQSEHAIVCVSLHVCERAGLSV